MPLLERGGHTLHYETFGEPSAPPLLLIMGLAVSGRAWDTLPGKLARRYRVIVFDNRGTGRSGRRGFLYRMRDLADDASAVLEAAGVPDRAGQGGAFVFGISMGGMIAQELALRHPQQVRALALGATFASWLRSRKPAPAVLRALLLSLARGGWSDSVGNWLVSDAYLREKPHGAREWMKRAERTTARFAFAQLAAVARHAAHPRLGRIRAPTLVLTGDQDRLVPAENSALLAKLIPGARLVVLPGAGHAFPLEQEDLVVRSLEDHFQLPQT